MRLFLWIASAVLVYMIVVAFALSAAIGSGQLIEGQPSEVALADIPPDYLSLYQSAARAVRIDWAILAAIGSIETDHGRIQGGRCATSSAGARGPMQFMPGTWERYGLGDVCDPTDAIPAAARYLRAGGAPGDYHVAILAYNHAEWYYRKVVARAEEYRSTASTPVRGQDRAGALVGTWLVDVPGTSERCDARIVPNVEALLARYHATLTACYAAGGHAADGEHPLGLAVDLVPRLPATWESMGELARFAGWRPSCSATGCAGQTRTPFRFIGWNGYPNHGDPSHAGLAAHLHLSWDHGPGRPAEWVSLLADG